jgi:hypothetical protein
MVDTVGGGYIFSMFQGADVLRLWWIRSGAALAFENASIALGTGVAINILQEFVLHRLMLRKQ